MYWYCIALLTYTCNYKNYATGVTNVNYIIISQSCAIQNIHCSRSVQASDRNFWVIFGDSVYIIIY